MRGINKVILVGNVGNVPEVKAMPDGNPVANFSVATNERWKDRSGQQQERTEWHRVVAFGKLAGIIEQYVGKGEKVYIEGKLRTRQWTDQQDTKHYATEVIASEMQMLGEKKPQQQQMIPANDPPPQQAAGQDFGNFDEDIPF